jgi:hypothetical protein
MQSFIDTRTVTWKQPGRDRIPRPAMSSLSVQIVDPPHSFDIADFSEIPLCRGKIRMT